MNKLTLYILALAAVLTVASQSFAQTTTPPASDKKAERLGEVIVKDTKVKPSLTVPDTEAAKKEIEKTPGGVNLIDAEQYRDGRATTFKEMLDFTPGVFAQPRFGAEETRLSIRGSGIQRTFHLRGIKLLHDGVPISLADGGGDFQAIDPLALRYIQIFRGANALQFGAMTLGGAINFVTPTGHDAARILARVEGGSEDFFRAQLASGGVHGAFDYYVTLTRFHTDGFRNHSQQENNRVFSNVGWRFSDSLETRFYVVVVDSESELPGSLTKAQMEADPRQANAFNVIGDQKRDYWLYRFSNKTTVRFNDDSRLELGGFWSYKDLFHPIFQVIDQVTNDYGVNARFVSETELFGRKNLFLAGINLIRGETEADQFVNVAGQRGARTADGTQVSNNIEFYAENQHYVSNQLALVLGLQAAFTDRKFYDRFLANGDQSDYQDFFAISPKFGARYELNEQAQIFANISRSFEPPSFGELSNLGGAGLLKLNAQKAWTFEIGTRGESDRIAWEAVFYHARVRNELLGFNVGVGGAQLTVNARDTIHQGVELGVTVKLREGLLTQPQNGKRGDRLLWRNTYTWGDFRFDGDPTWGNNQLPGIPAHVYRGELRYEHPCGFYLAPNVEWSVEKYPVDMANQLFADHYALLGVKMGYRSPKGWSVFFEAKNLTDENYAATTGVITSVPPGSPAQFLPGDGRAFYGGIEWRW